MIVIYIIGGLFALILAVYFLDKREKMTHEIKEIKEYRHDIEETNRPVSYTHLDVYKRQCYGDVKHHISVFHMKIHTNN